MSIDSYQSPAWLLEGLTGSTYGTLQLVNSRLSYTANGVTVFDVPIGEVREIVFPWYYFSGGVKFRIGADKYRIAFVEPGNRSDMTDVVGGRDNGKIWKRIFV